MKRFIIVITAALLATTSLFAQEVEPPVVTISGQQFQFTPNQITLRRGQTVTLRVTSSERIHRLYSKELGFRVDLRPNQPHEITLTPMRSGRFVAIGDSGQIVINVQ